MKTFGQYQKFNEEVTPGPRAWTQEIEELENFFASSILPIEPVRLNSGTVINDVSKFITNHLSIVKYQDGNVRYLPYLNRLTLLKSIIQANNVKKTVQNDAVLCQKCDGIEAF